RSIVPPERTICERLTLLVLNVPPRFSVEAFRLIVPALDQLLEKLTLDPPEARIVPVAALDQLALLSHSAEPLIACTVALFVKLSGLMVSDTPATSEEISPLFTIVFAVPLVK